MKKRLITNFIIIAFSLLFAARVITIFAADRMYSMSLAAKKGERSAESASKLLSSAIKLDSSNAELYAVKSRVLEPIARDAGTHDIRRTQLALLKSALELRPLWPKYHLEYGVTVGRTSTRPNIMTRQLILSQLKKAAELKPYSSMYQGIYQKYLDAQPPQTP